MDPLTVIKGLSLILQFSDVGIDTVRTIGALIHKASTGVSYTTEESGTIDALFESNHAAIQNM